MHVREKTTKTINQDDNAEQGIFNQNFKNAHSGRGRFSVKCVNNS